MAAFVRSLDGTLLATDLAVPTTVHRGAVLVHGGGVTRDEGGFFVRLADHLADTNVASVRFDLRGHGESEGRQEDLTLAGIGNDIRAVAEHLAFVTGLARVSVIGTSFSGGVCATLAARRPSLIDRLVLFNPLLDYKKRFVDDKDYWTDDRIDAAAAEQLATQRYVAHSPSFRLGTCLLNEVFWWDARAELGRITAPTLIVHGTKDTFIPVQSSRDAIAAITATHRLVEVEGAQHGFAVHDDPGYHQAQTQQWQADVIAETAAWLRA